MNEFLKEDIKHEFVALVCVLYGEEPISQEEFDHRIDNIKEMVDKLPGNDVDKDWYLDNIIEYTEIFEGRRKSLI